MSQPIRILATGLRPAHWNVAMTAALAELHAVGQAPDTVRFHRYPPCVLLGRSQEAETAIDIDYCRHQGIDIARRVTGGGGVFMSPSMLAWDVVIDRWTCGIRYEEVTRNICGGVADGLSRLGVEASFHPPGDIEIRGRKMSGSSGCTFGRSAVLQGTVLIRDEVPVMSRALRLPEGALRGRVTSLETETGAAPPAMPAIMQAITVGLAVRLGREPVHSEACQHEHAHCEALLRDEIGTDAYVAVHAAVAG